MTARRALLVTLLAIPAARSPLAAQSTLGFKAGLTSATISVGGELEQFNDFLKRRSGIAAGAFLTLGSGALGLQIEGLYVQKGVGFEGTFEGSSFEGELQLAYVEVPALLRVSIPAGALRPYLYAGAAAAFEVKCSGSVTVDGETGSGSCEEGEDQSGQEADRRKLDLTALGGGGVQFGLGGLAMLVELRYARGLQNIDKSGNLDGKNEALSLLAGITLPLGGR